MSSRSTEFTQGCSSDLREIDVRSSVLGTRYSVLNTSKHSPKQGQGDLASPQYSRDRLPLLQRVEQRGGLAGRVGSAQSGSVGQQNEEHDESRPRGRHPA